MIEIRHLRLVRALADEGSMSAAARHLGYSQSAVTQQIQGLERHLGTPVVTRTRRGVRLTEAGEVLLQHARGVVASVELAESEVEAIAGLRSGRVRVVSFPSGAATILPGAFGELARRHPGLRFVLHEAEPERALEMLRCGESDVAVVYGYGTDGSDGDGAAVPELLPDEVAIPLAHEAVHLMCPPDHPAVGSRWVELTRFRDSRWIAGCPECRTFLLDACAGAGFEPDIAFETDDYVALQELVAAGLGVALVPDLMLTAAGRRPSRGLLPLSPRIGRTVSAVSTTSLLKVPAVRAMATALRDAAGRVFLGFGRVSGHQHD